MTHIPTAAEIPFKNLHDRFILARVESFDFYTDANGEEILDENGNFIPTGLLNIILLEREGSRFKVPFCVPFTGNTGFFGGLPEIGTVCLVGWMSQNMPVVIGFLPFGNHNVITKRQTIPNLTEGELFLQASIKDHDINNNQDFYRGASLCFDRYGRIRINAEDYEYICGHILSDEFTPDVSSADDPISNEPVFLREKLPNGTERRISNLGSSVSTYGGSKFDRISKNYDSEVNGSWSLTVRAGVLIQDERSNNISFTGDGSISLSSVSGAMSLFSLGTFSQETNGSHELRTTEHEFINIGKEKHETIGGSSTYIYGDMVTIDVHSSNYNLSVLTGEIDISSLNGITLETVAPLAPIKVGSMSSDEPLPLGNVLINALDQLSTILSTTPIGISGVGPVQINPTITAQILAWKQQFLSVPATNIISQKVFTERE